jgi:hypothetical protein
VNARPIRGRPLSSEDKATGDRSLARVVPVTAERMAEPDEVERAIADGNGNLRFGDTIPVRGTDSLPVNVPPQSQLRGRQTGQSLAGGDSRARVAHLEPAALHGLAGEIVTAIDPHTEADLAAVLLTLLASFGAIVGPGPHAVADGAKHPARIWPLIVGDTAKSRKGSSWAQVRRVLTVADADFSHQRTLSGFGSGEALVDAVAPPGTDIESRPHDLRLLAVEPEFAAVLARAQREGSTLSPLLRQGWDGDRLQARARARTSDVEGAHIVLIGHITHHELRARLAESDVHGGLLNRFLIVRAHRSKLLPTGGDLDGAVIQSLGNKLGASITAARKVDLMKRTAKAEDLWTAIYTELANDDPGGLLGAVVARDSAQMLRLSVHYALLNGRSRIDVDHLCAAQAVWRYCRASAALTFGEMTGDPVADKILVALHAHDRLTGTQVRDLFQRHMTSERIDQAVQLLIDRGLVTRTEEPTKGRPVLVLSLAT